MTALMTQSAPYPTELADLVSRLRYRPGWKVRLWEDMLRDSADTHGAEGRGLTLVVFADVYDTYHPDQRRPVNHYFIVPAATYNREAWKRWLLDCILKVEQHEATEWFVIEEDGEAQGFSRGSTLVTRPFAPTHGPGDDPYVIVQYATEKQRNTSFRGVVKE